MAITCVSKITPIDIPNKIVSVSCEITNDAEPMQTVTIRNADISDVPKKAAVADTIWAKYLKKRDEQLALNAIGPEIDQLETDLDTNIQGRTI